MKIHQRFAFFLILLFSFTGRAQIELPKLISDGVILQRDTELRLWGWASANEEVTISFKKNTYNTIANDKGEWELLLPPQEKGGPFEMVLSGSNEIKIENILFGDVYIASGQSNMELSMERVKEKYRENIGTSENDHIREFKVPQTYNFQEKKKDFPSGQWVSSNPEDVLNFSAVAYFFAREINEKYDVPVGIINNALGGSPVESWMSEEVLKEFPEPYSELQKFKDDSLIRKIESDDQSRIRNWYRELDEKDRGLSSNWKKDPPTKDWKEMDIPGYWADGDLGPINGAVWFKKELDIPLHMAGRKASLWLGRLVDRDSVWVNGEYAGTTGYQYPPRRYSLPSGVLKEGKNIITIRLINEQGKGGFVEDKPYFLAVEKDSIDLRGTWQYAIGATMEALGSQTFIRWKPAGLYNAMVAPLEKFKVAGVLWYQGESNTSSPGDYAIRFRRMIEDWRKNKEQEELPFLYVQLANFMEPTEEPRESSWAELRQAQLETLSLPNTGMVVAIDLGEWNDIHPLNKYDIGRRLALQAEQIIYKDSSITASGPIPVEATFEEDRVIVSFSNTGSGLRAKDGKPLQYFAISEDGKNFSWAKAEIKGNTVVVSSEEIKNPVVVRYAWADNPDTANFVNGDGLPASPFQLVKNH